MANFCSNCGSRIGPGDKFCMKCGTEIEYEDKFCGNCGARLSPDDNFCGNCGAKIETDIKQNVFSFELWKDGLEKRRQERLKVINEIFESKEIKSEIRKNNSTELDVGSIKFKLRKKLIDNNEKMSEEEIRDYIKKELRDKRELKEKERIAKEKEAVHALIKKESKRSPGGYCSFSCEHYYEEILDAYGGVTADYTDDGGSEYYCDLGHSLVDGRFCEDYE